MFLTKAFRLLLAISLLLVGGQITLSQTIEGVNFSGPAREITTERIAELHSLGAEWVSFIPYAYGPGEDGRIVFEPGGWQWWGERSEGIRAMVQMAKDQGLRVMLKPHLWLGHGEFTGAFSPKEELGWEQFEQSYADYILHYARMAADLGVDLYCIGTEMERFVLARPAFWNGLIAQCRAEYNGTLTYAANWDEVERFPFWPELDRIGVDGYFPLVTNPSPTIPDLIRAWKPHVSMLASLSHRMSKKIVFTEIGYCSTVNCTSEPWKEDGQAQRDEQAQADAYNAFFRVMDEQKFYSGCFVWKWFADGGGSEERGGRGFSPQGKQAFITVREAFDGPSKQVVR